MKPCEGPLVAFWFSGSSTRAEAVASEGTAAVLTDWMFSHWILNKGYWCCHWVYSGSVLQYQLPCHVKRLEQKTQRHIHYPLKSSFTKPNYTGKDNRIAETTVTKCSKWQLKKQCFHSAKGKGTSWGLISSNLEQCLKRGSQYWGNSYLIVLPLFPFLERP